MTLSYGVVFLTLCIFNCTLGAPGNSPSPSLPVPFTNTNQTIVYPPTQQEFEMEINNYGAFFFVAQTSGIPHSEFVAQHPEEQGTWVEKLPRPVRVEDE